MSRASTISRQKRQQESLRDRMMTPRQRWAAIMQAINAAERLAAIPRNTPAACLAKEKRILAGMRIVLS